VAPEAFFLPNANPDGDPDAAECDPESDATAMAPEAFFRPVPNANPDSNPNAYTVADTPSIRDTKPYGHTRCGSE
jgi:hypothetical protein